MAQAVTHQPFTTQAKVHFQASPVGCVAQSGIGTGFTSSTLVFLCQYHSTSAPYPFVCHQHCIIVTVDRIVK